MSGAVLDFALGEVEMFWEEQSCCLVEESRTIAEAFTFWLLRHPLLRLSISLALITELQKQEKRIRRNREEAGSGRLMLFLTSADQRPQCYGGPESCAPSSLWLRSYRPWGRGKRTSSSSLFSAEWQGSERQISMGLWSLRPTSPVQGSVKTASAGVLGFCPASQERETHPLGGSLFH